MFAIVIILGLLIVAAAATVGVTGVLSNRGSGHQIAEGFNAFGHTFHGSAGQLFFWGLVIGAGGFLGLVVLFAGLRGSMRRRGSRTAAMQQNPQTREVRPAAGPAEVGEPLNDSEPPLVVQEEESGTDAKSSTP
jgi:flagellar biosynthesis component FlhA